MKNLKIRVHHRLIVLALLALSTLSSQPSTASAQGTAFTYQGRLNTAGAPANGLYDFRFKLATDPLGDNYVGDAYLTNGIFVTNGLFTTSIDFGAGIFTGTNYWLEVDVRTNNPANTLAYSALAPLQGVTPAPYAVMANSASNLLGSVPVAQLSGTVSLAQLPASVVTNDESGVTLSNVTVSGSLNLPATASIYSSGIPLLYANNSLNNFFAGLDAGNQTMSGYANTGIGNETLVYNITGIYNTALGILALVSNTSGNYNTAIGSVALYANTNGFDNTALGFYTLESNTSGSDNTASGYQALIANTSGSENVAAGSGALEYSTNDNQLVAIGYQALQHDNAYLNGNTSSGNGANTAVGYQTLQSDTIGAANTAIGYQALNQNTNGIYNTAVGDHALLSNTSGSYNNAIGVGTLYLNTSGSFNTANGVDALEQNISGSENVAEGFGAMALTTNDIDIVAIGYQALQNDNAFDNGDITSGSGANTAVGYQALQADTLGYGNTAVGYLALNENLHGAFNTANGLYALYSNNSGNFNSAYGIYALLDNTSGSENIAFGFNALGFSTNGSSNIALGAGAGDNLTSGDNNIYIGNYGNSVENGVIRIGTPGTHTITYLPGALNVDESGLNIGNINSNALTFGLSSGEGILSKRVSGAANSFDLELWTDFNSRLTVRQNGYVGIGTTNPANLFQVGNASSPAYCNGTTWVNGSDRNSKEGFTAINAREVLAKISALPITEWKYKVEADGTEHLGPMAQDFHAAFGLNGADDKHIATVDEEGVALAAIQGLNQKLEETQQAVAVKDGEIQTLKQQNDSLAERLNELETTVKQLVSKK